MKSSTSIVQGFLVELAGSSDRLGNQLLQHNNTTTHWIKKNLREQYWWRGCWAAWTPHYASPSQRGWSAIGCQQKSLIVLRFPSIEGQW